MAGLRTIHQVPDALSPSLTALQQGEGLIPGTDTINSILSLHAHEIKGCVEGFTLFLFPGSVAGSVRANQVLHRRKRSCSPPVDLSAVDADAMD